MPITRREFDAGERSLDLALLAFLHQNTDSAYTAEEVFLELEATGLSAELHEIEYALAELLRRQRVEAREIDGAVYYSYDRRIGFRPPTQ